MAGNREFASQLSVVGAGDWNGRRIDYGLVAPFSATSQLNDLLPIVSSVLGTFLIIVLGAVCRWCGWLTPAADTTLARLTANVMLPAYFFANFSTSDRLDSPGNIWLPPLVGFAMTTLGFAVAAAVAWTIGPTLGLRNPDSRRAFTLCAGIANYGYLPLPLAERFYPSAIVDLILHNIGTDGALWSIGILIIAGMGGGAWKRAVLSPPLLAVVFALAARYTGVHTVVPESIAAAVARLGDCAVPLGLLLSGAIIVDFIRRAEATADATDSSATADSTVSSATADSTDSSATADLTSSSATDGSAADPKAPSAMGVIAAGLIVRLAIMPVLMLGTAMAIARTIDPSRDLSIVLMLQAAMPAAVFPIVIVRLYERDTETALRVVLWTSVAGVVTIPFWIAVGSRFLAIES